MTRRLCAVLAALAMTCFSCGYYAPPVRPEADGATPDAADTAPPGADRSEREGSDD